MSDPVTELVKVQLKQLRLPAMARELERLSREAAASNRNYEQFLLGLAEAELTARSANALQTRIKHAAFPVAQGLRHLRLQRDAHAVQAEAAGTGAGRMD